VTSGALVLPALGAIGLVIWYSMLQDLPAEGSADGRCRRSVAGAGGIAASHGSGDGGWGERGVMVMNCRARSMGWATAAAGSRVRRSRC
jgi:hypothetical protein